MGCKYIAIEAPPEVDAKAAVLAWRQLLAITHGRWRRWWSGQEHLIWEYRFTGAALSVRVWVPGTIAVSQVTHALDAAWPGAAYTVTDAEPPLPTGEAVTIEGGVFIPARHALGLPLVADAAAGEVLRGLVAAGAAGRQTERAVVQIVARPASSRAVRRAAKVAAGPRTGGSFIGEVLDLVTPGAGHHPTGNRKPVESNRVTLHRKAVAERLATGSLWTMQVRYAAAVTGPKEVAIARARDLAAGTAAVLGGAWRRRPSRRIAEAVNAWAAGSGLLVSADELAVAAHVPSDTVMPALARAGARPVAPVAALLGGGRGVKTLGQALGGQRIGLAARDARQHVHVIGSTGSGKSTLLLNMMLADIRDKRAVVLIDPKGDLVNDLLDRLDPAETTGRLVLIDPDRTGGTHPRPGLPPIAPGTDPEVAIDHLVGICRRLWERHWGPRANDILQQSLRTQVYLSAKASEARTTDEAKDMADLAGLTALPILLTNKHLRQRYTAAMDDDNLREFWTWFDSLPPSTSAPAVGPVLARLRSVLGRSFVRETIGAPPAAASIDLGAALDNGGIVLARLPKGTLGEDTAKLVGSILFARVWQSVLARQGIPEERRRDCVMYVDECQNFMNLPDTVGDVLAEARALRLSTVLAHQHLGQLDRELESAISSNCRNKVFFTISPEDARRLSAHTAPNLTEHDLAHLGGYTAAARLVSGGVEQPACTLTTFGPPDPRGDAASVAAQADRFPAFRYRSGT
ncbi:type IV secretion system DNA-binding domain-containing protein [Glycomyces sp. TRM65418]|uniref:type IV secretory system conjugative DNA transfer family protein n=1 Tax=Glycomyces sp. TRM65418 TaxID=2867006 RepID=UPI001CE5264E|nr:type IV secretion system DNA-binding domain-containing protein [Glycomyces sp. TRM65418]MCC3762571.1 type IV secretion system DNA-binding domain-containing protein [Glycomyces sp. TRM65418]QZD56610.1 type IV secretion system DNA-binding domain-containing protein [Glycomyces sp. TRM65418]